jgi:hypothetical protein
MPWFKVDDQLAFHPKVITAGNAAMGLWVRAGAWASDKLTDGYVPGELVGALGGKKADADRLVAAGLWERDGDGYRFHDWGDQNPSKEIVEALRNDRVAASARANHNRWHVARGIRSTSCELCKPIAKQSES